MVASNYGMGAGTNASAPHHNGVTERVLDMDAVSQAILVAEGDLAHAAERLLGNKQRQDTLLDAISSEPAAFNAFATKTRALALIKTLNVLSTLQVVVTDQIGNIDPDVALKMFARVAEVIGQLTQKPVEVGPSTNIYNDFMRILPAPLANAIKAAILEENGVITMNNAPAPATPATPAPQPAPADIRRNTSAPASVPVPVVNIADISMDDATSTDES